MRGREGEVPQDARRQAPVTAVNEDPPIPARSVLQRPEQFRADIDKTGGTPKQQARRSTDA